MSFPAQHPAQAKPFFPLISNKRLSNRSHTGIATVTNSAWCVPGRMEARTKHLPSSTCCSMSKRSCGNTSGGASDRNQRREKNFTTEDTDYTDMEGDQKTD